MSSHIRPLHHQVHDALRHSSLLLLVLLYVMPPGVVRGVENEDKPPYLIGYTEGRNDLPDGQFANWVTDHAVSATSFTQPYAIGGCREITPDGWIIGSLTDVAGAKKDGAPAGHVHFFRIPATVTCP